MTTKYRLGVDVGGTHTDLVLLDVGSGAIAVEKVATTPANPALGIMRGIGNFAARGVDLAADRIFLPRHDDHHQRAFGNARRQGRAPDQPRLSRRAGDARPGARRQSVRLFLPEAARRSRRRVRTREIGGRIDYTRRRARAARRGRGAQGRRRAEGGGRRLDRGLLSVLVHESRRTSSAAPRSSARCFPTAHVSLSCEVLSRVREWPRLSATLLNAYLAPVLVTYVADLEKRLDAAGLTTQQRFLMQSNGGVMPFAAAVTGHKTVHSLLSGPAAGAQASAYLPREEHLGRARTGHPRHGRHQLRHRLHRRRRAAGSDRRHGGAPAARRAGARSHHHLGRRRLDRVDRPRRVSVGRAAERRRRSGAGLLRPRRRKSDRDRCRHRLRLSQSGLFPRRHAEARRRCGARRARDEDRQRRCA